MKQRVVSLVWGTAWERYGKEFVETFRKHWPREVELRIITDQILPIGMGYQVPLPSVPGYEAFMDRWRNDPRANGMGQKTRKLDCDGRSWKHNAVKWAPQGMAPHAALDGLADGDVFAWLDADVETIKDVPCGWLGALLEGHDVACLKRTKQHSEIGFWAVRVNAGTRRMIHKFGDLYASGDVFKLREWHSGYVFDRALDSEPGLTIRNLNSHGLRGHVWPSTPLAEFTMHKKGKLK